jgi:DNA-binding winged helix-turn-helix (wHTH) protein
MRPPCGSKRRIYRAAGTWVRATQPEVCAPKALVGFQKLWTFLPGFVDFLLEGRLECMSRRNGADLCTAAMIIRFGDCELDLDARELRRERQLVHVEPQVFDLLGWLISNRNRAVTKEELIKQIWTGRAVSDATLSSRINAARQAIGDSGSAQRYIRTLPKRGFRFVAPVFVDERGHSSSRTAAPLDTSNGVARPHQLITFCRSHDGLKLAVARSGKGLAVVKSGTWLTNVEKDWGSALWSPLYTRLASEFELIRYDPRGCGLSEWDAADISFERFVDDLEAVVDALQLEKFALLGISQGAAVSIAYAARHPDRVTRLVLSGLAGGSGEVRPKSLRARR